MIIDDPMPPQVAQAWIDFFIKYPHLEPGRDLYPEIFREEWLFPLQRMKETEAMIRMAREIQPKVVMEIGTDKGGSFFHWVHGLRTVEKAIAMEIRGVPFAEAFEYNFPDVEFLFIEGSSHDYDAKRQVLDFLGGEKVDCLFIDADKSAFDRDVTDYRPLVRNGGLIFLHDIQIEPNARFAMLQMADAGHRTESIIDTSEYDEIEKREADDIPPASAYEGWFRIWKRTSCGVGVVHV